MLPRPERIFEVENPESSSSDADAIRIPRLRRNEVGIKTGVNPGEVAIIKAVISLIDSLPLKPKEIPTISGELVKRKIEATHRLLTPFTLFPESSEPKQNAFGYYQKHLEEVQTLITEQGESVLKARIIPPAVPSAIRQQSRTVWENVVHGLNYYSRIFIQARTGVNCLERDESEVYKPIKIADKPL